MRQLKTLPIPIKIRRAATPYSQEVADQCRSIMRSLTPGLSRYMVEYRNPAWIKIKNRNYSQVVGRDKLFERRYEEKGAPEIGWDVCDRVCAAASQTQRS